MRARVYICRFALAFVLLLLLRGLVAERVAAQTGKEFWFDIPEVNRGHVSNYGFFVYLHITTLDADANITIELPADPDFQKLQFKVPKSTKKIINLTVASSNTSNFTNVDQPMSLFYNAYASTTNGPHQCPEADRGKYIENVLYWSESSIGAAKPYINRTNKGVFMHSDNTIMAYIEINVGWNMDLIALKGANALGRKFFVPMQTDLQSADSRYYKMICRPYPSFNIVATQDNTKIRIKVPRDIWIKEDISNSAERVPGGRLGRILRAGEHILWLNRGQSSIIVPYGDDKVTKNGYQNALFAGKRLEGSEIEVVTTEGSGGEIVVLTRDDIVISWHGNPDYVADQLVPVELVGKEFGVVRGVQTGGSPKKEEYVYIVGTEDNTKVYVSGHDPTTVNKGEQKSFRMNEPGNEVMSVVSEKPVYCYHMGATDDGGGDQKGGALIPALPHVGSCIGSREVAFSRTRSKNSGYKFYMNMLMWDKPGDPDNSASGHFRLMKGTANGFKPVTSTAEKKIENYINTPSNWKSLPLPSGVASNATLANWKWIQVKTDDLGGTEGAIQAGAGKSYQLINSRNVFHLGLFNGTGGQDNFYGYFSDFKQIDVSVLKIDSVMENGVKIRKESGSADICYGDTVRLEANASAYFNYRWTPAKYLNRTDTAKVDAINVVSTQPYKLYVTGMCDLIDSATIEVSVSPRISPTLETRPYVCGSGMMPFTLSGLQNAKKVKWMKKGPGETVFSPIDESGPGANPTDGEQEVEEGETSILRNFLLEYDDSGGDIDPQVTTYSIGVMNDGCVEEMERKITAFRQVPTPLIDVTAPAKRCSPAEYSFADKKAGEALEGSTYQWSFGKGKSSTLATPPPQIFTSTKDEEEVIPIKLTVTDKFKVCKASTQTTVTVLPMPQPLFTVNPTLECEPYFPDITNYTPGSPSHKWTLLKEGAPYLGLGVSNSPDISMVMDGVSSDGVATTYTVHLETAGDNNECVSTAEKDFVVLPKPTFSNISATIVGNSACSPVDVTLKVTDVQHASSYEWARRVVGETDYTSLSKGGKIVGNKIEETVTLDGGLENDVEYEIRLTLRTDDGNCYATATTNVTIPPKIEPKILAQASGCPDEDGKFTAVISNVSTAPSTTNYQWLVDGKSVPYDPNTGILERTFVNYDTESSKLHKVELIAQHGRCSQRTEAEITVFPQARASFNAEYYDVEGKRWMQLASNQVICTPTKFRALGTGAAEYRWEINDKTEGHLDGAIIEKDLQNDKDNIQNYKVKLIGMNDAGCKATFTDVYRLAPSIDATLIVKEEKVCTPAVFQVSLAKNPPSSVDIEKWDFQGVGYEDPVGSGKIHFRRSGTYSIGVTLKDRNTGCKAEGRSPQFKVETGAVPKIGQLTAMQKRGCSPMTVQFKNESTGANRYHWDFGDNSTSSSANATVEHTFVNTTGAPITYKVRLSAYNNSPCDKAMVPDEVEVTVYPSPKAVMDHIIPDKCRPGKLDLYDKSEDSDRSEWKFTPVVAQYGTTVTRPGSPGAVDPVQVTLQNTSENDPLEYKVTFFTSKSWPQGPTCRDDLPEWKIVIPPAIAPDIKVNGVAEVCSGEEIIFDDLSTGGDITHSWDFKDGTSHVSKRGEQVKKTFHNTGDADVTYKVTVTTKRVSDADGLCAVTTQLPILVHPQVRAGIEVTYGDRCVSPVEVTFNAVGALPGTSHQWEFGDGQSKQTTATTLKHDYVNPNADTDASFTVKLRSQKLYSSGKSCPGEGSEQVVIPPVLKPKIGVNQTFGCSPLAITFDGSASTGAVTKYVWDFEDENGGEGKTVTHTYKNTKMTGSDDTYNAKLTVYNKINCVKEVTQEIVVHPEVKASFVFTSEDKKCTPYDLEVKNSSINGTVFKWALEGSGQSIPATGPGENFTLTVDNKDPIATKFYTLKLEASTEYPDGATCSSTYQDQIEVLPRLEPKFEVDVEEGCEPLTVTFNNISTGVIDGRETWTFGDGSTSEESAPAPHKFANPDTKADAVFSVQLVAYNRTGCKRTFSKDITVYPRITPEFNVTPRSGCTPLEVEITNTSPSPAYAYQWNLGGGHPATSAESPGKRIYENPHDDSPDPQPETIKLKVSLAAHPECSKFVSEMIQVSPRIIADFDISGDGCHPLRLQVTNKTKAAPGETRYDWTCSDGATRVEKDPLFELKNESREDEKEFTIKLKATSVHKCVDSMERKVVVYPTPVASFTLADNQSQGCAPFTLKLTDNAEGQGLSYFYDFGDGTTKVGDLKEQTIEHIYANTESDPKSFTVVQQVTSAQGCKDVFKHNIYVFPQPIANFIVGPPGAGCSPFIVSMNNQSVNATSYEWTFQDGGTSTQESPTHRFVNPTEKDEQHTVKLVATSPYKCKDELEQVVTVYAAPEARFEVTPLNQEFPSSTVTVTNHSVPPVDQWNYTWEWGDDQVTQGRTPGPHVYDTWGDPDNDFIIPIKLTVANNNCTSIAEKSVIIRAPKPATEFTANRTEGCPPLEVRMFNTTKYAESWEWHFDDGTVSTEAEPTHVFEEPGNYHVRLISRGDGGESYSYHIFQVYDRPFVDFRIEPQQLFLPNAEIQAMNMCAMAKSYRWEFGDGGTSVEESPAHVYQDPGFYDVTLTAYSNQGCAGTKTLSPAVEVLGAGKLKFPNAFKPNPSGPNGGVYEFRDMHNEVFHPFVEGSIQEYKLMIFNRWGEQIFESTDISIGWDGYQYGKLCDMGVYAWRAVGLFYDGTEFDLRGNVTLMR